MSVESWMIYLALVIAATATPGPAVLFIMTNSILYGWKRSIYAALGNIVGLFCLGIIAVAGLGAILDTSVALFNLIKYAGAIYLIFLGIKLFVREPYNFEDLKCKRAYSVVSPRKIFFQAFGVAMSNPKAIIFLTALFPPFVSVEKALIPQCAILVGTLILFSLFFLMAYSLLAQQIKNWLSNDARVQNFNRGAGSLFIGFGLLLATSSNK